MARLLLDTHIVLAISSRESFAKHIELATVLAPDNDCFVSVASIWEIAIKERIGKLAPNVSAPHLDRFLENIGVGILNITRAHVVADIDPQPDTRDPFDRLLLAQCQVEGMRLVTFDRALLEHSLAWRNEKPAPVAGSGPA